MTKVDEKTAICKSARKKYISTGIALKLVNVVGSPLRTSYWRTYRCHEVVKVENGKTHSTYCKNRWCLTCQSIKIASMINRYGSVLKEFDDPFFVTLTKPTISGDYLRDEIVAMLGSFQIIRKKATRIGLQLKGIRKLECTVRDQGLYHPHFHILIDGEDNASWIVDEWLRLNPTARDVAQDLRPADEGTIIELFKYFTKFSAKGSHEMFPAVRLDVIFRAMKDRRVYQPFGSMHAIDEEAFDNSSVEVSASEGDYIWKINDWWNLETGEELSGYTPTDEDINFAKGKL